MMATPRASRLPPTNVVTFLFTDIEGSTRLWDQEPERMSPALARHDALARAAVESNHGVVVKMVGDGLYAAFDEPLDALNATLAMQESLIDAGATNGVALQVRCGLHAGPVERRDNDFFGGAVNRAARIMVAAHGGQVLLSQVVAALIGDHLPPGVALRDLGLVRLRDLASPEHVYQVVHPKLRQDFPALRSLEATPNNLPQQVSTFIGREREVAEVKKLLERSRLLTLLGVGGIGKTRLSLQVAADVIDDYPDGVWLVEFGSIADPLLVPASVAQVVGVREKAGAPLTHTLCTHLKSRRLLLVLDNCEHLIQACAELADALLKATQGISILATSREPLQVGGEQKFPLPSLSLPEPSASAQSIGRSDAVQLFVERARLQRAGFLLTERQAPAVAELCGRLDGIPLALELAAARVHSLSIEEIIARLDDRFRLLTGGTRTALPRQQTLRATLDWSYGLLAEQERAVLRRLAVFAGGCTIEAAEAITSEAIGEFVVIDALSHLVDRSLVVADATDAGTRYRLLETTRAYALEKLADARETDAIEHRHAQYFRDLFERGYVERRRLSDVEWCAAYLPERDNLRAALDWAFGSRGDAELGIALAGTAEVWVQLSLVTEGRQRLEAAVARLGPLTPPLVEARCWMGLAIVCGSAARARALTACERAIALYRVQGDTAGLARALVRLGRNLAMAGRTEAAEAALVEARSLLERTTDTRLLAEWSEDFGFLQILRGRPGEARPYYESALNLFRLASADRKLLFLLSNTADLDWALGDLDGAIERFREAVALARRSPVPSRTNLAVSLGNLAGALTQRGDLDDALLTAREAIPLQRQENLAWMWFDHYAFLRARMGRFADAALIEGYANAAYSQMLTVRQPMETHAHDRLLAVLRQKLPTSELDCLLEAGEKLTEDEACRIVLAE